MGTRQAGLNQGSRRSFLALPTELSAEAPSGRKGVSREFMELVALAQAQAEKRAASAPQDGPVSQ